MNKKNCGGNRTNRGMVFETRRQFSQLGLTVMPTSRGNSKGDAATKMITINGLDDVFYQLNVSDKTVSSIEMDNRTTIRSPGCLG